MRGPAGRASLARKEIEMRRTLRPLVAAAFLAAVAVAPVSTVGGEVQSIGTMHTDGSLVSGTRVTAVNLGTRVTASDDVTVYDRHQS
jgi:hypothetical protein